MAEGPPDLRRHQMVRVAATAWPALLAALPARLRPQVAAAWPAQSWPLVVRRWACNEAKQHVPLGLPLPPAWGRQRLSLQVPQQAVASAQPPPPLAACMAAAPKAWRATLRQLQAVDPTTRCFGSLAWQSLTGLAYLSASSDLDLLWTVQDKEQADALVLRLAAVARKSAVKIDGELVSCTGRAVQWQEWAAGAPSILVKTVAGVVECTRTALFA